MVFFYGGAWSSGRRQDYEWAGQALASRGFVVAVVDHRLVPQVRYPAFVEDGAMAVARARQLAAAHGGDPERILLAGHSSGAYVASMLALDPRWLAKAGVATGMCGPSPASQGPMISIRSTCPPRSRPFAARPSHA